MDQDQKNLADAKFRQLVVFLKDHCMYKNVTGVSFVGKFCSLHLDYETVNFNITKENLSDHNFDVRLSPKSQMFISINNKGDITKINGQNPADSNFPVSRIDHLRYDLFEAILQIICRSQIIFKRKRPQKEKVQTISPPVANVIAIKK